MQLLYALEQIRVPWLTELLSYLTYFGGLYGFMVLSIIMFWCIDKRCGYFMLSLGFIGTVLNQFLKILFRIPRPWVLDPNFQPVEAAVPDAGGFSFPSGHTQNVFATFGGVFAWTKRAWLKVLCAVMILLVAFSRMYLGVHTPLDVGVSVVLGIILLVILCPVFRSLDEHPNRMYGFLAVLAVLLIGYHKKTAPGDEKSFDTLAEAIEWAEFSLQCSDRLNGSLAADYTASKTAITVRYGKAGSLSKTLLSEETQAETDAEEAEENRFPGRSTA